MRNPVLPVLLSILAAAHCLVTPYLATPCLAAPAGSPADRAALERAWHDCLRESFAQQSSAQGRAGSQRNALDECKAREDALVAALMSARDAESAAPTGMRSLPARARAWAASVAAYVVDPLSSWIDVLRN